MFLIGFILILVFLIWIGVILLNSHECHERSFKQFEDSIVICVYTGAKYYNTRCRAVKETWGQHFSKMYYHGVTPNQELPVTVLYYDSPHQEDYGSAIYKNILGMKQGWIDSPNEAWYFSCGCDTFVYPEALKNMLATFNPDQEWFIGGEHDHRTDDGMTYVMVSGGPGLLFSRRLMKRMHEEKRWDDMLRVWKALHPMDNDKYFNASDQCISFYLAKYMGIFPTIKGGMYHDEPKIHILSPISYHYRSETDIRRLYAEHRIAEKKMQEEL